MMIAQDFSDDATDPEPTQDEIERLGENSAALSDLSVNLEQDEYPGRPKSKGLSGWFQLIKPMIHGRFMWALTTANFIFIILLFILIIYILVFSVLFSSSHEKEHELSAKLEELDYCSVIWEPLGDCSAKCKEAAGENPRRETNIAELIGQCPNELLSDATAGRNVPCNVWSCE